jgi:hypothetical protein
MTVKTVYIIKLVSYRHPNARYFLRANCKRRITKTSHPALARTFATPEKAQELIAEVAHLTGFKWEIETYMGKGAQ